MWPCFFLYINILFSPALSLLLYYAAHLQTSLASAPEWSVNVSSLWRPPGLCIPPLCRPSPTLCGSHVLSYCSFDLSSNPPFALVNLIQEEKGNDFKVMTVTSSFSPALDNGKNRIQVWREAFTPLMKTSEDYLEEMRLTTWPLILELLDQSHTAKLALPLLLFYIWLSVFLTNGRYLGKL